MRKIVWTFVVSLLILAPVGCGTKSNPAPKADGQGETAAAATPVFQDGFEKGKADSWEATKTGERSEADQSPAEKPAAEDSE